MKILKKIIDKIMMGDEILEEKGNYELEDKSKEAIELRMMLQNSIVM
ncbi:hypothetical protein [Clostridium lundense]|nr:hypothetical protein [Clostridium lundense]